MMTILLVLFAVLAILLTILLIYRSTLVMHEDDQLFLDAAESHMAREQEEIQSKLGKIEPMVKVVGVACGVILLTIAGMWVYQGLNSTGGYR
jgi:hypothetical protein